MEKNLLVLVDLEVCCWKVYLWQSVKHLEEQSGLGPKYSGDQQNLIPESENHRVQNSPKASLIHHYILQWASNSRIYKLATTPSANCSSKDACCSSGTRFGGVLFVCCCFLRCLPSCNTFKQLVMGLPVTFETW